MSLKGILDTISLQGLYMTIAYMIYTWVFPWKAISEQLPDKITEESLLSLISVTNSH